MAAGRGVPRSALWGGAGPRSVLSLLLLAPSLRATAASGNDTSSVPVRSVHRSGRGAWRASLTSGAFPCARGERSTHRRGKRSSASPLDANEHADSCDRADDSRAARGLERKSIDRFISECVCTGHGSWSDRTIVVHKRLPRSYLGTWGGAGSRSSSEKKAEGNMPLRQDGSGGTRSVRPPPSIAPKRTSSYIGLEGKTGRDSLPLAIAALNPVNPFVPRDPA